MEWMATAREQVRDGIAAVEREADEGRYRPGPWDALMRVARSLPRADRGALASEISRVSAKLHCRKPIRKASLMAGLAAEIVGAVAGAVVLLLALQHHSNALAILAAAAWIATLQPLIKVAVGYLVGIDYEYVYLFGIEPRFKMRYGDYLAAARWARIIFHLSGTIGSPLSAWLIAVCVSDELWIAQDLSRAAFWIFLGVNAASFVVALFGVRRAGPFRLVQSSGGAAALELREAMEL